MKRFAFLLGPELLWMLFFLLACWLASRNAPPTPTGNTFLERAGILGAFVAIALTFTVFFVPGVHRGWLLGRVIVAVVIGVNACLFKLIDGVDYGDSRNSGVVGIWVYGILAGGVAFVPGIITTLVLLSRGSAPPE
ncbi:hypothetical protein [Armatimonas sp.]|uniref:hypothetical protein n=1 Tax=Armatimonas sp. TaxID=1872638 RepID=UPI00286CC946|nr:hypothetical protein [Armatimonas sp.]